MHYTILQGNVEKRIDELPDNSVHVIVTSPPYYGLRDYGTGAWEGGDPNCKHFRSNKSITASTGQRTMAEAGFGAGDAIYKSVCGICGATRVDDQIGLEPTPELYVERLVGVFSKLRRVLREDGVMFLNIGDSYWGSGGDSFKNVENGQRGSLISGIDTRPLGVSPMESLSTKKHPTLKPKDLIGIPWMLAFALRNDGWYLRSEIIWGKNNPMPESVKDRPTKAHEQIFLLTKSKDYFYDYLAIAEPVAESTVVRAKSVNSATARKDGGEASNQGGLTPEQQDKYYQNMPSVRNKRSIWMINTQGYPGAHFATFPMELPEVCIRAGSSERGVCLKCGAPWERVVEREAGYSGDGNPYGVEERGGVGNQVGDDRKGDKYYENAPRIRTVTWRPTCACDAPTVPAVVMDPFCGSGTTGEVALRLGRSFIGIELSQKYIDDHIKPRLDAIEPLFNTGEYK